MGPTVRRAPAFDAKADARALHGAMKGLGCDKNALIKILCHRSVDQRVQIAHEFFEKYDKKLEDELKSELRGDMEQLMVALALPTPVYLAREINDALTKRNKNVGDVVEICTGLTKEEMDHLRITYDRLFGSLINDVRKSASGAMENLLVSIVLSERSTSDDVNSDQVYEDVKVLYKAGEGTVKRDENAFADVLGKRSWAHIRKLETEYESATGHSLKKAIVDELAGGIEKALLAVLQCAKSRASYYAHVANEAMKGIGTNDRDLIRVIVSRCDVDLEDIKEEYARMYGKSLKTEVQKETSGDYGKALLALIN